MNQFKIILIIAFTLLGCNGKDRERPEQALPPSAGGVKTDGDGPQTANDGYNYTISVASNDEFVYVYYSVNNLFPVQNERFFRLEEGECLRIREGQFNNLSIFASKGSGFGFGEKNVFAKFLISQDDDYMPLCNATLKCSPNNYSISTRAEGWMGFFENDQFVMLPVKVGVFEEQCDYYYNLDKWMEFKVRQLGEQINKEAVDDSSKTQIEEWIQ